MSPRDTRTGQVLEQMINPALRQGGYEHKTQVIIGKRLGGRPHKVDAVVTKGETQILVSLKWQQVGGTAEQKVPFEVMCLAEVIRSGPYQKAYVVLGGEGWSLRDFYTSGALKDHLIHADLIQVVTLESFIALANQGRL